MDGGVPTTASPCPPCPRRLADPGGATLTTTSMINIGRLALALSALAMLAALPTSHGCSTIMFDGGRRGSQYQLPVSIRCAASRFVGPVGLSREEKKRRYARGRKELGAGRCR